MIVWGGARNVRFNSGGRYYPDIDLWVSTNTTNAPVARSVTRQSGLAVKWSSGAEVLATAC